MTEKGIRKFVPRGAIEKLITDVSYISPLISAPDGWVA